LLGSQKAVRLHDRQDGLVERSETAIPAAVLVAKGQRERLQAGHAGHFLDAVDQQGGARTPQHENESGWRRRQAKVHGGVYDVYGIFTATHDVLHFAQAGLRNLLRCAGETVHAANFLHGSGRDGKKLAADAEQDDLLSARGGSLDWKIGAHYLTPTGVAL